MSVRLIQVDAFTDEPFAGNPAAICLLPEPRADDWMQAVAAEMNLSETAFVWPIEDGYSLRWFTPTVEVDLCGHATIAAAHAMWTEGIASNGRPIVYQSKGGQLIAEQQGDWIELNFPSTPAVACDPSPELIDVLHVEPLFFGKTQFDSFVVVELATLDEASGTNRYARMSEFYPCHSKCLQNFSPRDDSFAGNDAANRR